MIEGGGKWSSGNLFFISGNECSSDPYVYIQVKF